MWRHIVLYKRSSSESVVISEVFRVVIRAWSLLLSLTFECQRSISNCNIGVRRRKMFS